MAFKSKIIVGVTLVLAAFLLPYQWVNIKSSSQLKQNIQELETHQVGILLGTSKYRPGGGNNLFYKYRVQSILELYKSGKIEQILISGDNAHKSYDEPTMLLKDLLKAGVPRNRITLDYAGFRTWDSVVRASKIFGLKRYIIVSQEFHLSRALFIAEHFGHEASGYLAQTPGGASYLKMTVREHFARILMIWDIIWGTQPKFLGKKEPIPHLDELRHLDNSSF